MPDALNPRKKPTQARAQVTQDAILEAATHIIARDGLSAFNTNAIAARAGVSIGSLYQYFPNKDALMVALIERQLKRQLEALMLAANTTSAGNLESVIRALVRAAMLHHRDDALLASAIDQEEARLPISSLLGGYLDQAGTLVAAVLMRFADHIRPINSDIAARTIPTLVRSIVDAWANISPPQLDVAEDEAVRAVLGYLRFDKTDVA